MKRVFAISLSALMLSIAMKDLVVYAFFKAQQDYLAENICINRFNPEALCYAACVLTDIIQDGQKKPENLPGTLWDSNQPVLCILAKSNSTKSWFKSRRQIVPIFEEQFITTTYLNDIFHPPEN